MSMNDIDLGWLAGVFDGEAYFSIYTPGSKPHLRPRALVRINQAGPYAPAMMSKLQRLLDGNVHTASRLTNKGKTVMGWQWQSAPSMRAHLPLLLPHLTVKRDEAEVMLRFVLTMGEKGRGRLTPEQHAERAALAAEILAIRGGPQPQRRAA